MMKSSLAFSLVMILSCKKEVAPPANAKSVAAQAPAAAASKPAPGSAAAMPAEYKPSELWDVAGEMQPYDRMQKFVDGVAVSATVAGIKDDPEAEYGIEVDAGNQRIIELRFADFGKAAKAKALKAGDAVAVGKCAVTNPEGNRMALVQCELK